MSTDIAAAVIVRAVHFTLDCIRRRFIAELPVAVKVQVTVWSAANVVVQVFTQVPVLVNVAKVFAQVIEQVAEGKFTIL